MEEEITIIDTNTRNEKIINFFKKNKKNIIIIFSMTLILLVGYFSLNELKKINKIKLGNEFNNATLTFKNEKKEKTINTLIGIIKKQDRTYSPLALYFLLDNNLIENKIEINNLFNILIDKTNLEKEIKNLIIYKKALYNSNFVDENELINLLNPIINSESIWKSHALYFMGEYFFSKNKKENAKEYLQAILTLENANQNIKVEAQKRLNRDLGE
jgi:predicted negative regulator of RcsB-dependent stress response